MCIPCGDTHTKRPPTGDARYIADPFFLCRVLYRIKYQVQQHAPQYRHTVCDDADDYSFGCCLDRFHREEDQKKQTVYELTTQGHGHGEQIG